MSLAVAALCFAGATRTWLQGEYSDFEKGQLHGLSMRSDGRLLLAPKSTELFDASSAYLWALARDSKGNLYVGGGPGAKLYMVAPDGSHKKLAEFDALEIHAIAVDPKDRIYIATSPDGKIYRVDSTGKSEEFYNPKQKYIWGMVFGPQGDLFVATGDAGEVHRVDSNGKGTVFFKTEETHARSIAVDKSGNLIIGTDPGGLVIRVSPTGNGFVLYQMSKHEVTAVALAPDGAVYAAGVAGSSLPATPLPAASALLGAVSTPLSLAPRPMVSGGVDLYRIDAGGAPEKVWTNAQATVYGIAFDKQGRAVLATGNKGVLYRVETPTLWTNLLTVNSTQITALIANPDGGFSAIASNVGKVFRFGPELETQGSVESEVFDAGGFSQWGRLKEEGTGKISLLSRSGNLDRPQTNWSPWATVTNDRTASPPARFIQWKAILSDAAELDSVETAYLPKNVAPTVNQIESTPPNYKFPPPATGLPSVAPAASITLGAMGKNPAITGASTDLGTSSMTLAKGWIGARWNASDENNDALMYAVEIRGTQEKQWKPLVDKIRERHYSFDSTALPDGEYRLRVTASDGLSNVKAEALTGQDVSAPFYIDNTPPEISGLTAARDTAGLQAKWKAADALNVIKRAEYSVDGGDWTIVEPLGKLSDSLTLDYDLVVPGTWTGEHTIAVRVTDDYDNTSVAKSILH